MLDIEEGTGEFTITIKIQEIVEHFDIRFVGTMKLPDGMELKGQSESLDITQENIENSTKKQIYYLIVYLLRKLEEEWNIKWAYLNE